MESIIKLIDEEIERILKLPMADEDEVLDGEEIYDEGRKQGWFEEVVKIKKLIMSAK